MENKSVDIIDEALRILHLEKEGEKMPDRGLMFILADEHPIEMTGQQKEELFSRLSTLHQTKSLGQLIRQKLRESNQSPAQLSVAASLPGKIVEDVLNDKIYTNNIPIMLFSKMLKVLNISFVAVEKAVRKTFDLLQNQVLPGDNFSLHPAMRKHVASERHDTYSPKAPSAARELYENKEALDKYVSRLQELMNSQV